MSTKTAERLKEAVNSVPGWTWDEVKVEVLDGGVTNSNFMVISGKEKFFLKIFGVGTEAFIERDDSHYAALQAYMLNIGPKVIHYDKSNGIEVFEFMEGYRASLTSDYARKDFLQGVIDLYTVLHKGKLLSHTKTMFDMTQEHIDQGVELNVHRPVDFDWLIKQYSKAQDAFLASGLDLVPCHNDPMPGNIMVSLTDNTIENMKLIDFEYASNNERAYEIGLFLQEMFVGEKTSLEMIEQYYGQVKAEIVARVTVARALADIKWGNWALQQRKLQSWDFDYQKYGIWKLARARILFNHPNWDNWLRTI